MGNPLTTTESGSDGLHKLTRHAYDHCGRLQTITKPDGVTLNHAYDVLGRLTELVSSDNTISYRYVYDLNNNLLSSTDCLANTATQRCYDQQNRLIQETLPNSLTLAYIYDDLGRVTNVTLPDGTGIHYAYHGIHLCQVSRLDSSRPIYTHTYDSYDLRGLELEQTLIGNAGHANLAYDLLGRLKTLSTSHWSENIPEDGFDAVGNLIEVAIFDPQGTTTNHYQYDDLYQLIGESGDAPHLCL